MQLPRASIVVETVRYIGVLLDLTQRQTCADGVERACGNEEGIARPGLEPLEKSLDFARDRRGAHLFRRQGLAESGGDPGARLGREDVPHLGFPRRTVMPARIGVAGVNLHGELV